MMINPWQPNLLGSHVPWQPVITLVVYSSFWPQEVTVTLCMWRPRLLQWVWDSHFLIYGAMRVFTEGTLLKHLFRPNHLPPSWSHFADTSSLSPLLFFSSPPSSPPGSSSVPEFFRIMTRQFTGHEWSVIQSAGSERQQLAAFYRHWVTTATTLPCRHIASRPGPTGPVFFLLIVHLCVRVREK